ncbi:NAD-dependent succinate-semialdehyde dehydrogenase [Solicola sp. PLA-1-18]|uniref:NAD-dependent succinate-semialdehyde dehydrogenase n=1 Tax=Solicola sp. PLA-1-18 TaxID=3380532 RepID=UPI003B7A43C1
MSTIAGIEVPTGLLIDGEWRPASDGATMAVDDPATEETVAHVASATAADVDDTIDGARRGFAHWRGVDAWGRSAILRETARLIRQRVEDIATVMTTEQGKPLAESRAETHATADQFDWYADEARRIYGRFVDGHGPGRRIMVRREPVGVVAAFSTWNFPALLASRKIAPALAAGCSVVVKPAEETPLTTLLLLQILVDAGLPAGAVQSLTGDPAMISEALVRSEHVRHVSLTGSVPIGQTVMRAAAEGITSVSMELGGHAPVLIFGDADVEAAARLCVGAKFRNAGQVCASPSRFFAHESIAEQFTSAFVDAARALRVGDGRAPDTDVGPLTNDRRLAAAERLVADASDLGGRVVAGGRRTAGLSRGNFYDPTVITDVDADARIMHEEPFAPVAPIGSFTDLEHALALANGTDFGLASYVFTRDLATAFEASERIEAGMVAVNHMAIATAEAPFGGVKKSGFGREGGAEGIDDYTVTKYVSVAL